MGELSDDPDTRQVEIARFRRTAIERLEHKLFLAKEDAEAFSNAHDQLFVGHRSGPDSDFANNRLAAAALRAEAATLAELHRWMEELAAADDTKLPDLADRLGKALGLA